jgi:hypothetical protein
VKSRRVTRTVVQPTALVLTLALVIICRGEKQTGKPKDDDRVELLGERLKEIQQLRDVPSTQLIPVMRSFTAALGVSCAFCHTLKADGSIDPAAPDKEEQKTARVMIKMVREINQRDFGGQTQVGCFTCHAGHAQPQRFPPLPVDRVALQASPAPTPAAPPAATLIDNYIAAMGGEAALAKVTSCMMRAQYTAANGLNGTYESEAVAPQRAHDVITTSRGGRERIADRDKGWESSPYGMRFLPPQQAIDVEISQPLLLAKQLKDGYSRYDASSKSKIDDRDVFVLSAIRRDGRRERLYFATTNGLLVRRVTSTPTPAGLLPEQVDFSDYREVDGLKFPFSIRVATADSENPSSTRTVNELKVNVPIDPSRFEKPKS